MTKLERKLQSFVRKALYDHQMINKEEKIAIALSGGKDSLSLLHLLHQISGRGFPKFKIYAIYVGGEFSCGAGVNEAFLKNICKSLDVELIIENSTQTLDTLECYRCSRERRKLIFNAAKKRGIHTIAFGHHRDDVSQTLLMNLLQKAEFAGMLPKIPMQKYGVTIIRPLIYISEEALLSYAEQKGFLRITCKCPVGQNSLRKKVDHLLTEMEEIFPNVRKNLATASLNYGSDKALTP